MDTQDMVNKQTYAGLFVITLATVMYEILLTRIFSVTMWYHFAFVAISIAVFGMTVGAIVVYCFPNYFTQERARYHLALSAYCFAVLIILSFLTHLSIPFVTVRSVVGLYSIALTYGAISIPFVFSGICVCVALTKFPRYVSKLYAADLIGAAFGGIALISILNITDGPTAVVMVAFIASGGAILFAVGEGFKKLIFIAILSSVLFASFAAVNTALASRQSSLLRLMWVKGNLEPRPLYEKWNAFSRIIVSGDPEKLEKPFGWSMSSVYPSQPSVRHLGLSIDAAAGTVLTAFKGDLKDLEHLKYDVTNIVHSIRRDAKVLVVGPGGGRDILSALAFGQKSVLAVEINKAILDVVNKKFGDFTGHLDQNPKVTFVNDEARSYIARQKDTFDIIQVSLIDTWAATTTGAFVLTENSLYTVEAWNTFLSRLNPNGVLTFSRWYFRNTPGEIYRLTSLASASLMQLGIKNPRDHIVIVRNMGGDSGNTLGIGTILVSKEPFSLKDVDAIERVTREMRFDLVLTPKFSLDSVFATLASGKDSDAFAAQFPIDISAPTDDRPFFFHMLRLRDMFDRRLWAQGAVSFNMKAVLVLGALLIIVVGLTLLGIIGPLLLTTDKRVLRGALPSVLFFASIGFGFMLVEISQLQRFTIFLGHPTYSISVVLFALLVASGLGSYSTKTIGEGSAGAIVRLGSLLSVLAVVGMVTPSVISAFQGSVTALRIAVAVAVLLPLGFVMGMAFPLGIKLASAKSDSLLPWLWGINGATSVCASVLAVVIALNWGISASFWAGFLFYGVAFVAFGLARRASLYGIWRIGQ